MTAPSALPLVAAALGAGVMNALAGGGTILTYPALLVAGHSAITANATSTVALLPGALASLFGYRREVARHRDWLRVLLVPSLIGGAIGAVLLLLTPPTAFATAAPWLILFATVLFAIQGLVARGAGAGNVEEGADVAAAPRTRQGRQLLVAWLFQLGVSIYGGYFGAGIGILMLAVLGFLGLRDIHAANGVKNFMGMCINVVAAAWFLLQGAVDLESAAVMTGGAVAGGYLGARLARRVGRARARAAVVVIGVLVAVLLLVRQGH